MHSNMAFTLPPLYLEIQSGVMTLINMCLLMGKVLVYNLDTVVRPKVWRTDLRIIISIVSDNFAICYATLIIRIIPNTLIGNRICRKGASRLIDIHYL